MGDENVLKWTVLMVATLKYNKSIGAAYPMAEIYGMYRIISQ